MSGEPSKIMIDPASVSSSFFIKFSYIFIVINYLRLKKNKIISLKAELLNKQNAYRLKKLSNCKPELEGEYEVQKVNLYWFINSEIS